ncbi:class I SAM-dependent methyltransferase [Salegentibacter sp. Hel_I_6]|uniref:class I SAM-dependent methyltransferase n=1 Tax=Salegentibacter sp. Hel_I_6 TaxID=1250278 RepID=UPI0005635594|nr:class I SAM-dependent methyltransferase [Salegentibacter sp. Hel_I_6]
MKDNFSSQSSFYARYRPTYPQELYAFLKRNLAETEKAWDCGTGNGQVAGELSKFFREVKASDISKQQLENAVKHSNIDYSLQPAEKTNYPDNSFDLITVAQAFHWFKFDAFFNEAKRVLKPNGIIAIIGYSLFKSNPETNKIIEDFYENLIGPYWDVERKYLDEHYQTIPFPFREIKSPQFKQEYLWTFGHLIGYLKTWSAVKHYENAKGENPVDLVKNDLQKAFGNQNKVVFPILTRIGEI